MQQKFTKKNERSVFGETKQLQKWQANRKRLKANKCLQYYMNYVIKTHITLHFFSATLYQWILFKYVSVQSFTCFSFCHFHNISILPKNPSVVFCEFWGFFSLPFRFFKLLFNLYVLFLFCVLIQLRLNGHCTYWVREDCSKIEKNVKLYFRSQVLKDPH